MRFLFVVVVVVLAALALLFGGVRMPRVVTDERVAPTAASVEPRDALAPLDAPTTPERQNVATEPASAAHAATTTSATASTTGASSADPRCRVFGRVTGSDARPLAEVRVSLTSVDGPWSTRSPLPRADGGAGKSTGLETTSKPDGTFEFEAPLPTSDWITLRVEPSIHFGLHELNFGSAGGRDRPRLVAGDNDMGDIRLPACGAVTGVVRSEDGAPLAGASVRAAFGLTAGGYSSTRTDQAGRFVLGHITPGQVECSIRKEGWRSATTKPVVVQASVTERIDDVVLGRASEIAGLVVDTDGRPASGVRIEGWPVGSGQSARTTTREDGTFTMSLPQTEPYVLEINRAQEYEPWGGQHGAPEFTFAPGTKDIRIVLRRNETITFRVVDAATRAPIESFGIALDEKLAPGTYTTRFRRGAEIEAHPGGRVTLSASAAKHEVLVRAAGYTPYEGPIVVDPASRDVVTVALSAASSLRGRIVRGGSAIAGVAVTMQRESLRADGTPSEIVGTMGTNVRFDVGGYTGRLREVTSDAEGRFAFDEVAPGTYALTARGSGVAAQIRRGVVVATGGTDLGDWILGADAILRGRLLAPAGVDPVGYTVRVDGLGQPELRISAPDGSFEFTGLAPGAHVVTWSRPNEDEFFFMTRSPRAIDVELVAGLARDLTIDTAQFEPSTVRVRVLRGGRPAVGLRVRGERIDLTDLGSRTFTRSSPEVDAEGWARFEIDGGTHFDLVVLDADAAAKLAVVPKLLAVAGQTIERVVEVRVGSLVLVLPPALAVPEDSWSAWVRLTSDGQPALHLHARPTSDTRLPSVKRWSNGTIDLGELPAGTYQMSLQFQRTVDDPAVAPRRKMEPLRPAHEATITIEDGVTSRFEVP